MAGTPLMREIGKAMERAGADVEYLLCSGDPDSLDGLVIPSIRCGICDGTSPHVMEPVYPAAVERYVDLGRFYDLPAAKAQTAEVKRHTRDYRDAYARAYRCLKAARQVELDTVAEAGRSFDSRRAARRISGIMSRELRGRGSGTGKITPAAFWAASPIWAPSGGLTAWKPFAPESMCWRIPMSRQGRCCPPCVPRRCGGIMTCSSVPPRGAGTAGASADSGIGYDVCHVKARHGIPGEALSPGASGMP